MISAFCSDTRIPLHEKQKLILFVSLLSPPMLPSPSLGEVDCKEMGDCVPGSGSASTDLCLPALDYLRRCSQV